MVKEGSDEEECPKAEKKCPLTFVVESKGRFCALGFEAHSSKLFAKFMKLNPSLTH